MVARNISGNIGKSERNHAEKLCLLQSLSIFSMAGFREWCSWRIFETCLKESSWPCLAIWQMAAVFIIQPPNGQGLPCWWISAYAKQRLVYTTTKLLLGCPVPTIHPAQGWHEHCEKNVQTDFLFKFIGIKNICTIDNSTWSLYWLELLHCLQWSGFSLYWLKKSCKTLRYFYSL